MGMMVAARGGPPRVTLRFLAGQATFSTPMEVTQVARHRYVLGYFVLGICMAAFFHAILFADGKAALEFPIAGISLFVFVTLSILYVRLWVWLASKADHVTVWMPPGFLVAACAANAVSEFLHHVSRAEWQGGLPMWIAVAGIYALAEVVMAVAVRSLIPRVQRALRAGRDVLAIMSRADDTPVLTFGITKISSADILRIEANGNHVQIVTEQKRHIVPGPFANVIDQLPKDAGFRVHRSHWVAAAAVRALERGDRGLRLRTVQGDVVPVSQGLSRDLEVWLKTVSGENRAKVVGSSDQTREPGMPPVLT